MECIPQFLEQVLKAVVDALPSFFDWVITRLRG